MKTGPIQGIIETQQVKVSLPSVSSTKNMFMHQILTSKYSSHLSHHASIQLSNTELDDDIMFQSESESEHNETQALEPWKILIADDDTNVHDTTVLALSGVLIHGRHLEFMHAYSAQGAHLLAQSNADIALVLLDVVMETSDAGLKLVPVLRNELGRKDLKIIMRTGQPGYAKEAILESHNIDGYASKAQLTRTILVNLITNALVSNNGSSSH